MKPIDFFSPVYFLLGGAVKQQTESREEYHLAAIKPTGLSPSQILQCHSAKLSAEMEPGAKPKWQMVIQAPSKGVYGRDNVRQCPLSGMALLAGAVVML